MLSYTEENYLKAVLKLSLNQDDHKAAGTNSIAAYLDVKPATATDMLKKLKDKCLIDYEKYGKVTLSDTGKSKALDVLRKHRLWETFLFQKLGFSWDEVHEVAEQLEHIQSTKLVAKLDEFLGFPRIDPHGDLIPNDRLELNMTPHTPLCDATPGTVCKMIGVKDNSATFLKYVTQLGLAINDRIHVVGFQEFDGSMEITFHKKTSTVSKKFAENIWVEFQKTG